MDVTRTTDQIDHERSIHTLPVSDVYTALKSRIEGLSEAEARERLQQFGPNTIHKVKRKSLWVKFLANFTHMMAILLWVGGVAALIARMPQLAVAVWMVNVINGAFSFWQEYRAEQATEALQQLLPQSARILRDGEEKCVPAEELVPGDVILLAEGDRISADGRLVEAFELRVDQSTLSGEAHPVRKTRDAVLRTDLSRSELPNLVFASTSTAAGTGKAVVVATGMQTEFGKIAHLTQSVQEELSPLQIEMKTVTKVVTVIAVAIGAVFFLLAVILARITWLESFVFAVGMIVAFVPEGLLPTVTLSLAMGTQRMAKRHALVKRLSAVETLGCTTVICTDKTGTLTQNEMTVGSIWLAGRPLTVSGTGYAPEGRIQQAAGQRLTPADDEDLRQLLVAAVLCNNARLLPPNGVSSRWTILGDPTEAALTVVARKAGLDPEEIARQTPRLREVPFESRRKRMSTIHQAPSGLDVYVKGAPKETLALCTRIRCNGQECEMTDDWRAQIVAANDEYARNGLRVLAVAKRALPGLQRLSFSLSDCTSETIETGLVFLGLMAMMDPPRPEVTEAVAKCHRAGIRAIMITGDYGLTAESIARRIGIVQGQHPRIVTGADLETIDDPALEEILRDEVIFARAAPEHKLRVVTALKNLGHVVAVTGDGVNDAPALKKADIGVAMGLGGTDVAKEAADMILTDDNFASIVNAVEEGRAVYSNIKKFSTYIFTSNAPEAVPFILYAFTGGRIPLALNVMHVLAIDLGTDIVPALALGSEPPEPGLMDRPPRPLNQHVITWPMLFRAYGWLGMIQSAAAMAAFYYQYWLNGYWGRWIDLPGEGWLYRSATAMALAAVVATQVGNLFAQRSERNSSFRLGWFSNPLLWGGIATELVVILAIVYVPVFQTFVGTAHFALRNWLFLLALTPLLLLADEVRKTFVRRRERRAQKSALHSSI